MKMQNQIIFKKEIELLEDKYLVYLKKVATRLSKGGVIESTTVRAFVKKLNK